MEEEHDKRRGKGRGRRTITKREKKKREKGRKRGVEKWGEGRRSDRKAIRLSTKGRDVRGERKWRRRRRRSTNVREGKIRHGKRCKSMHKGEDQREGGKEDEENVRGRKFSRFVMIMWSWRKEEENGK